MSLLASHHMWRSQNSLKSQHCLWDGFMLWQSQKSQMLKCFYSDSASPGDVTWPQQHLWSIRYLVSWLSRGLKIGKCLFSLFQLVFLAPQRCQPPLRSLCCFFGVDVSIFTWSQVMLRSFCTCWCSQLQPVLVAGVRAV